MHIQTQDSTNTSATITVSLDAADLEPIKNKTVKRLGRTVKVPGFRPGKAPLAVIEKSLVPERLYEEVIRDAVAQTGDKTLADQKIVPAARPEITIDSFTPFSELNYSIKVEFVGDIKVGDLSKVKVEHQEVKAEESDVDEILDRLRQQQADKVETDDAAKDGDEVWIDFAGFDAEGKAIEHADGKDYPLRLGSKTFIDGFEENLVGHKKGDEFEFTVSFPKDYRVKSLADMKATFKITVNKVTHIVLPELTDAFAAKVSDFKSMDELKADIRQAVAAERTAQAQRAYETDVITKLVEMSSAEIPQALIDFHADRLKQDEERNLASRGISWEQHLQEEGMTEEEHKAQRSDVEATKYITTGLVLTEIAKSEGIKLEKGELDAYIAGLKKQYASDQGMQQQLSDPRNREELGSRLLTEKTVNHILAVVGAGKPAKK